MKTGSELERDEQGLRNVAQQRIRSRLDQFGHHKNNVKPHVVSMVRTRHVHGDHDLEEKLQRDINAQAAVLDAKDREASGEQLRARVADGLRSADEFKRNVSAVTEMCRNVVNQVEIFREYSFVSDTGHGKRALEAASALGKDVEKYRKEWIPPIDKLQNELREAVGQQYLNRSLIDNKLKSLSAACREMATASHPLGERSRDVIVGLEDAIDFEILKGIVQTHPDRIDKAIKALSSIAGAALSVGGSFAGPFEPVAHVAVGLKSLLARQVVALKAAADVSKLRAKGTKAGGLKALEGDPGVLTLRVAEKYKADFGSALDIVGMVVGNVKGWGVLSALLRTAAEVFFDKRAEAAIRAHVVRTNEQYRDASDEKYQEMLFDTSLQVVEEVPGMVTEALRNASFDPYEYGFSVAGPFIKWVADKIFANMSLKGAQMIAPSELRAQLDALREEQNLRRDGRSAAVPDLDNQRLLPPTEDSDHRKVDQVLQNNLEHDSDGRPFWWVRIGKETGKLYRDGRFTAENRTFPQTIKGGRAIRTVVGPAGNMAGAPENSWLVIVEDLLGHIPANGGDFTPIRPATTADWSKRVIQDYGYDAEGGRKVEGTWYRISSRAGGKQYYLFEPASGPREWAEPESVTADRRTSVAESFKRNTNLATKEMALPTA